MLGLSLSVWLPLSAAAPAHAGSCQFTASGSMAATSYAATPPVPSYTVPTQSTGSYSLPSYNLDYGTPSTIPSHTTVTGTVQFNLPLTISVAWVPDPKLASDPAPFVVRLLEFSNVSYWAAGGATGAVSFSGAADDGFEDPLVPMTPSTGSYVSSRSFGSYPAKQYNVVNGRVAAWTRTLTATATGSVSNPTGGPGGSLGELHADLNSYSISVQPITAAIRVDQDQQVSAPAATTYFSATISNLGNFTIDSVKISVDGGTPIAATVNPNNSNSYFINWPSATVGNPSEHTVTATAVIHDPIGSVPLDSTRPEGNGRPADAIIADVRLQSLKFNNNILLAQDATTPVPTPEFTWTASSGSSPATYNPAAYIQGKNVNLTMTLGSSAGAALTGSATLGYALKLQATPNTTNPTTKQADPTLTLYDNTTGNPFAPTPCGSSFTVAATTALDAWVAEYSVSFPTLGLYVKFTHVTPAPVWRQIDYYSSFSNTLYAVLATPTAPMSVPWVGVLNDACNWAKRTSDATSATTALATWLYTAGEYNGGLPQDTDSTTSPETFYLSDFVYYNLSCGSRFQLRDQIKSTKIDLIFESKRAKTTLKGILPALAGQNRNLGYYNFGTGTAALYGQCNDFSDFLVCASNAIGASPLQSQRVAGPFETNPITASHDPLFADAAPRPWNYHQFTGTTTFFDGCLRFQAYTTPANLSLQTYESGLIAPGYSTPAYPLFVPIIKKSRSNP